MEAATDLELERLQRLANRAGCLDGAGRAVVTAPRDGAWWIAVTNPGFAPAFRRAWAFAGTPETVRFLLRRGHDLSGAVRGPDGLPTCGATVLADPASGPRAPVGTDASRGITGRKGEYRLAGLAAGRLRIRVRTAEGVVHEIGTVRVPGVSRLDIRLGGGVTVKGVVLEEGTGKPLPGVRVAAEVQRGGSVFAGLGVAVTGEDGTFRVFDLPPGDIGVLLCARKEGYRSLPPSPEQRKLAFQGPVSSGMVLEREIRLAPGKDEGWGRPPAPAPAAGEPAAVEGIVVDSGGAPASGVTVSIWSSAVPSGVAGSAVSDAEGRFRVEGIPPGRGSASARPRGREIGGSASFTLEGGKDVRDLRIAQKRASSVAGWVRRSDGAPPEGLTLFAFDGAIAGDPRGHIEDLMRDDWLVPADADGSFRVQWLRPPNVVLIATAKGCAPANSPVLTIAEGEDRTGVEIVLVPNLTVSGRVMEETGQPVSGAIVSGRNMGILAVTDGEGRFHVEGLDAGSLALEAEAEGFTKGTAETTAGGEYVSILIERVLALSGRVVEEGTGKALGGIPVRASPDSRTDGRPTPRGNWVATTAPDGTFRFEGIPDGTWSVTAGEGGSGAAAPFLPGTAKGLKAGSEGIEIALRGGTRIEGMCVDEGGAPFGKPLLVQAYRRGEDGRLEGVGGEVSPGADGTFVLGGLEAGAYDLWLRPGRNLGDESPPPLLVKGVATGGEPVVVRVPRGIRLRGRIRNLPGGKVTRRQGDLQLKGTGETWWPACGATLREDGSFETEPLDPSGTYDLLARNFPGRMGALRGVRPGTGDLDLYLSEGLSIRGSVVDDDGAAVGAGVPVVAWAQTKGPDEPGARSSAVTDPDGTFTVAALGEFRFGISAGGGGTEYLASSVGNPGDPGIAPGQDGVVLHVRRGLAMEGRLVDGAGNTAKGLLIEALSGSCPKVYTGEDGSFILKGLTPGEARLRVGDRILGPFPVPSRGLEVRLPGK